MISFEVNLKEQILRELEQEEYFLKVKEEILRVENDVQRKYEDLCFSKEGFLTFRDKICVPNSIEIRQVVLIEVHYVHLMQGIVVIK